MRQHAKIMHFEQMPYLLRYIFTVPCNKYMGLCYYSSSSSGSSFAQP